MPKDPIEMVAGLLLIIGGLNWGLIGLLNTNAVNMALGTIPMLEKIVYILVGLSALYMVYAMYMKK